MTQPPWILMNKLDMFKNYICENIENAIELENRLVNLLSSSK